MADYFTKFSVVLELRQSTQQEYALNLALKVGRHRSDESPVPGNFPADLIEALEDWHF